MYERYPKTPKFVEDLFEKHYSKYIAFNFDDLEKSINELIKSRQPVKQDDMTKKPVLPQYDSKYRIVKRTANNKTQYFVEFCNPTKIGEDKYYPVPGKFTFDTAEEGIEQINLFKKQTAISEEVVYQE